jgi:hypothetical protein
MKSVKEITEQYNDELFGIEIIRHEILRKQLKIKSWWGKYDIYEKIRKDLKREGYTVLE